MISDCHVSSPGSSVPTLGVRDEEEEDACAASLAIIREEKHWPSQQPSWEGVCSWTERNEPLSSKRKGREEGVVRVNKGGSVQQFTLSFLRHLSQFLIIWCFWEAIITDNPHFFWLVKHYISFWTILFSFFGYKVDEIKPNYCILFHYPPGFLVIQPLLLW